MPSPQPLRVLRPSPQPPSPRRSLADKLADIAARSPKDYAALIVMVDFVLARLDALAVLWRLP